MKPINILRRLAAFAFAAACSASFADSQNMTVSATVVSVCQLQSVPAMSFSLDPSVGGDAPASSAVTYKCTKGLTPTSVTVGAGASPYSGTLASATVAGTIAYSVSWTNPTTAGAGFNQAAQTVTLTGKVLEAAYLDAIAATDYTASVAVAINP